MRIFVYSLIVLLAILHQDFWWRADDQTIVLGFLPVSLAYHMGISVVASILWGAACYSCWPRDADEGDAPAPRAANEGGH